MADDIIERLRKLWFAQNPKLTWDDMEAITEEAADEITRLRAENEKLRRDVKTAVMGDSAELQDVKRENEKLRKALAPFAATAKHFKDDCKDTLVVPIGVDVGYLRAAAAALKESGE